MSEVEAGRVQASLKTLTALGMTLGADLSVRFFTGASLPLRDRFQAPMVEALLGNLHDSWRGHPEVRVTRPARGFIDIVLVRRLDLVATEAQSELRRLEAQIRWHEDKAAALPSSPL